MCQYINHINSCSCIPTRMNGMGLYSICICLYDYLHMKTYFKAMNKRTVSASCFVWDLSITYAHNAHFQWCIHFHFSNDAIRVEHIPKQVNFEWSDLLHDLYGPVLILNEATSTIVVINWFSVCFTCLFHGCPLDVMWWNRKIRCVSMPCFLVRI